MHNMNKIINYAYFIIILYSYKINNNNYSIIRVGTFVFTSIYMTKSDFNRFSCVCCTGNKNKKSLRN